MRQRRGFMRLSGRKADGTKEIGEKEVFVMAKDEKEIKKKGGESPFLYICGIASVFLFLLQIYYIFYEKQKISLIVVLSFLLAVAVGGFIYTWKAAVFQKLEELQNLNEEMLLVGKATYMRMKNISNQKTSDEEESVKEIIAGIRDDIDYMQKKQSEEIYKRQMAIANIQIKRNQEHTEAMLDSNAHMIEMIEQKLEELASICQELKETGSFAELDQSDYISVTELEEGYEPEPEVELEPEVEIEPEIEPEPEAEPELEVKIEPEIEMEPEAELEPEVEIEPEPEVEIEPEIEMEPEVEIEPEIEMEPEVEIEPEAEPEPEVELESEAEVEAEPEPSPNRQLTAEEIAALFNNL